MQYLCRGTTSKGSMFGKDSWVDTFIKGKWYEVTKGKSMLSNYKAINELGELQEMSRAIFNITFETDPVKLRDYKLNQLLDGRFIKKT